MQLTQTKQNVVFGDQSGVSPIIIAGPCSAETRKQVFETAEALKNSGISYFRAGIWKPRTNPDSFAGAGAEALKWLGAVREKFGLRTAPNHLSASAPAPAKLSGFVRGFQIPARK